MTTWPHDHITKTMENNDVAEVQVTTYDFSKAFDRLRHDIIINRMENCGMPKELICWIANYLEGRHQVVKIGTISSQSRQITSGVPQGSILGPFLFSVVIGSLVISHSDSQMVKYADDVTICTPIYKSHQNFHVRRIHDEVVAWSDRFELPLNLKKSKAMVIPRSKDCDIIKLRKLSSSKKWAYLVSLSTIKSRGQIILKWYRDQHQDVCFLWGCCDLIWTTHPWRLSTLQ